MQAWEELPELEPEGRSPSIRYTGDGFVVVGAENADSGELMFATDDSGKVVGLAFADGDGTWENEIDALVSGVGCVAGVGITAASSGMLA